MLALTTQPPWPFAFLELGKRHENRGWSPKPDRLPIGGLFALHGGAPSSAATVALRHRHFAHEVTRAGLEAFERYKAYYRDIHGIFALAVYGGYETASDSPWFVGPKGWVIRDLFPICNRAGSLRPIDCPGAQGLWEVPEWAMIQIKRSGAWHDAWASHQKTFNFNEEIACQA